MSKKSIRFFNDSQVRAVWDSENNKWWFSATDIVRAINEEENYIKASNYWRWLKKKLNSEHLMENSEKPMPLMQKVLKF